MLGHDVVDDGIAPEALADVEARVGAAAAVAVVELAVVRVERVDAVVAVAVRGQVRPVVVVGAGPEEPVADVVARRHVLDDDALGVEHADPVLELEPAVEDHRVAVDASDRHVRSGDVDRLLVHAFVDEDQVAFLGRVDRGLDGVVVLGDEEGVELVTVARSAAARSAVVVIAAARGEHQHQCRDRDGRPFPPAPRACVPPARGTGSPVWYIGFGLGRALCSPSSRSSATDRSCPVGRTTHRNPVEPFGDVCSRAFFHGVGVRCRNVRDRRTAQN